MLNNFGWKKWCEESHFEDPGVDGKKIFKDILNNGGFIWYKMQSKGMFCKLDK